MANKLCETKYERYVCMLKYTNAKLVQSTKMEDISKEMTSSHDMHRPNIGHLQQNTVFKMRSSIQIDSSTSTNDCCISKV